MNTSPTLQSVQAQVDEWITTVGVRYFSELTNMAILTEEVGELARIIARRYGDQSEKESDRQANLADEMADILWVLAALANQTGVDLSEAFQANIEKKTRRDADRHRNNPKLQWTAPSFSSPLLPLEPTASASETTSRPLRPLSAYPCSTSAPTATPLLGPRVSTFGAWGQR